MYGLWFGAQGLVSGIGVQGSGFGFRVRGRTFRGWDLG